MVRYMSFRFKRGQFLVLAALTVTIMILTSTTLLAYISVSRMNLPKTDFRKTVTQITLNSRRALATALAQVSKELNLRASLNDYSQYNRLEDYPEAKDEGFKFISNWLNDTYMKNAGLGLNLTLSGTDFECEWNTYRGYSRVYSNLSLDIRAYGFYGWNERIEVSLNLTILGLKESTQNSTSFYFSLQREKGVPVTGLTVSSVRLFYNRTGRGFTEVDIDELTLRYIGNGTYLLRFYSPDMSTPPKVKLIIQDARGILVGSFPQNGTILSLIDDSTGPVVTELTAEPNPIYEGNSTTLRAVIDDSNTGWSTIVAAEYFVGSIGENGTGIPLSPLDGLFDSPVETVYAEVNVTGWSLGNYTIYVHGRDAAGYWGNFSSLVLVISDTQNMHVKSIDMSGEVDWWFIFKRTRATAVVTVVDQNGSPVEGAKVYGSWSGMASGSVEGFTDENGQVVFTTDWSYWDWWFVDHTYTFTVTNIELEGWNYTPEENEETSDSITL